MNSVRAAYVAAARSYRQIVQIVQIVRPDRTGIHHKLDSPHFISFKFGDCLFIIWMETFH